MDDEPIPGPVPGLSTETSTTTLLSSGEYEASIATTPINYLDTAGDWAPIDTELVEPTAESDAPASDEGGVAVGDVAAENAAAAHTVSIPQDAGNTPVRVAVAAAGAPGGQAWITLAMDGLTGAPAIADSTATFDDVDGADAVQLQSTATGLKETIVLERPPAAQDGPLKYSYLIEASDGLTPRLTPSGTVEFRLDGEGREPTFVIPVGNMFDSSETTTADGVVSPGPAYTNDVEYALTPVAAPEDASGRAGWEFTMTPNVQWLTDPARTYPVMIDPDIELVSNSNARDCSLWQDQPDSIRCGDLATHLHVGRANSGATRRRSVLYFNSFGASNTNSGGRVIPADAEITHGNLQLWLDASQTVNPVETGYVVNRTSKSFTNGATWNSPDGRPSANPWGQSVAGGGPSGADSETVRLSGSGPASWRYLNVDETVAGWHDGTHQNNGIVVKQRTETVNSTVAFLSSSASNPTSRHPRLNVRYVLPADGTESGSQPTAGSGTLVSEEGFSSQDIDVIDDAADVTDIMATSPLPDRLQSEAEEITFGLAFDGSEPIPSDLSSEFESILEDMYVLEPQQAEGDSSHTPQPEAALVESESPSTAEISQVATTATVESLSVADAEAVPAAYADTLSPDAASPANSRTGAEESEAGCGGAFWPTTVRQASGPSSKKGLRYGTLNFEWSSGRLSNLNCRGDSTFEPDFKSYNYDGNSYFAKKIKAWSSTLPKERYKDTQFMDSDDERIYTIGTSRASKLKSGKNYRTYFRTEKGPGDRGKMKVVFQRGSRSPNSCDSTWCIFSEQSGGTSPRDRWSAAPGKFRYTP